MLKAIDFRPVILAGGSGTRFWPLSRKARPKQFLALVTAKALIAETFLRVEPLVGAKHAWVVCGLRGRRWQGGSRASQTAAETAAAPPR